MNSPPLLKIGNTIISPPFILAPLAGYTKSPFRNICLRFGCGLAFTELVTAEGLLRRAAPTLHYIDTLPDESPVAAHLYGSSPDSLAAAARVVESTGRFSLIDINCGCPVPKIKRRGAGAALMRDPKKIEEIVRAVSRAVDLPVTIKTRIGLDPSRINISEISRAVENGGGKAIFIHGRLASDRHQGPVDWDTIARVKTEVSIPIIGNGGITTADEAIEAIRQYGVDGVMIGRAALGNPWIFQECLCLWEGQPYTPPTDQERFEIITEHLRQLAKFLRDDARTRKRPLDRSEADACRRFYGHLTHYLAGRDGLSDLRKEIAHTPSIDQLLKKTARLLSL
ncbi:MAG: tRNA dihydrouridine synthase DusB [Candidatus Auribacterota bacterium]|nr:tRNA dihydrouridine synthase DusB [Candidatus Auribacterota bacterium]